MRLADTLLYGAGNIKGSPVRTFLLLLAMSIGVASVVMLSSLGEAARLYVVNQFSAMGTHLLIVLPIDDRKAFIWFESVRLSRPVREY